MAKATVLFVVSAALAIAALRMFEPSRREPRTRGVHRNFPFFVRMVYAWLMVAALLGVGATLWDSSGGIWGASRHARRSDSSRSWCSVLATGFFLRLRECGYCGVHVDVYRTLASYNWMYFTRFQRDSRISGICQLGVACLDGFGAARIG